MAESTDNQPGFFARLKQHHLYTVVVVYAVVAGFVVQFASRALPAFGWGGAFPAIIIILIVGFPVVVALAWTFIRPKDPDKYTHWQRLHWKLNASVSVIVVAAAVVSGALAWHLDQRHAAALVAAQAATLAAAHPTTPVFNPPADTLVVLPFANESGDPKQQYFSDGITEELTNALGQNTGLRVIAWDTASHYRDRAQSATDVGKALDIANVLTGKILREGNEVRVIVELVNARTGFQVWSNHYDDSLANVFQVQDQITAAIADALQVKFASLGQAPTVNPQAHDLVLQARALMEKANTAAPIEQARKLYEHAIALAPDYADAHAGLARAWLDLTAFSTLPLREALPKVREEVHKALALDPRNVDALTALANANVSEGKLAEAKAGFQRALALDPSNVNAHLDYGTVLPLKQALAQDLEAVQLDPDYATAQNNLAAAEQDLGEYRQALAPLQALVRLDPHSADNALGLAQTYALLHRNTDAVKAFDLVQPNTKLAKALIAAGRLTYQSLLNPKLHAQALVAVQALGRRADLDPTSMYDMLQLELALGKNIIALQQLPKLCTESPVICSDLSVSPLWIPLRGDPRFEALVKQYDTFSKPPASATTTPSQ